MKKLLSILLSVLMIFALIVPAFGTSESDFRGKIPVILISGDGEPIVDTEGNVVFDSADVFKTLDGNGNTSDSSVLEATGNILMPMLLEGVLLDKWDNYYDAMYKEISDLFSEVMLNENGEVENGTDVSALKRAENAESMTVDKKDENGTYSFSDYHFWYDWRLDPIKIADEFNEYVEGVKAITGSDKVCVSTRCIGHNVVMAYIAKYGADSIYGLGIDGTTTNGSEFITGALTGDFGVEGDSIARFLEDAEYFNVFHIDSFVGSTLQLLENSGALDKMSPAARKLLYLKIEKGVVSAIARATVFTMPCYWALVSADKFEEAKEYVFGKEGDPRREEYAGLIKKIDNYQVTVKEHLGELMQSVADSGGNVGIISKYGSQIVPIFKGADLIADQYASVNRSSFGATTSKIGETLSDEYIAEREAAGFGKYISPDRQIDASTCQFPDSTFFVKGVRHGEWSKLENNILMRVMQGERQLTVDDLEYSQFVITFPGSDDWEVMTEENCDVEAWSDTSSAGKPETKWGKLVLFVETLANWLKLFFEKVMALLTK